jgi:hypothetical protein
MRTDREMLDECLRAFEAIPVSAKARKVLKAMGKTPGAYAGNGSHILAHQMVLRLREHLKGDAAV